MAEYKKKAQLATGWVYPPPIHWDWLRRKIFGIALPAKGNLCLQVLFRFLVPARLLPTHLFLQPRRYPFRLRF